MFCALIDAYHLSQNADLSNTYISYTLLGEAEGDLCEPALLERPNGGTAGQPSLIEKPEASTWYALQNIRLPACERSLGRVVRWRRIWPVLLYLVEGVQIATT